MKRLFKLVLVSAVLAVEVLVHALAASEMYDIYLMSKYVEHVEAMEVE